MDLLNTNFMFRMKSCNLLQHAAYLFGRDKGICGSGSSQRFFTQLCFRYGGNIKAFASQNQTKKSRRRGKTLKQKDENLPPREELPDENDNLEVETSSDIVPSRNAVLQACTVTSGLICALGVLIQQVSHIASREGWPIIDCSTSVTFNFEIWHLGLIAGSVILVSSCRFVLLKTWPDFSESSEAANRQVLTSLEPLDYIVVAFLPGISEEILFRGALMPIFGINNWTSILAVAALFGVLHLGSGRRYSFAIWATFVGIVYGYATTLSSSLTVPMASHALNNLIGGIIWRYTSNSSKQIPS
ncbi:hypothetical protein ACJIZ3_005225 [Penstemon smallii]|uniref:CAAX prenyl protease 2/Lysostaphin resistance protein A-like domain-containing protein n=1 Tax=Penstemon smallii TaxID=265156 RepID=A0ABD3S493_9LAMI